MRSENGNNESMQINRDGHET